MSGWVSDGVGEEGSKQVLMHSPASCMVLQEPNSLATVAYYAQSTCDTCACIYLPIQHASFCQLRQKKSPRGGEINLQAMAGVYDFVFVEVTQQLPWQARAYIHLGLQGMSASFRCCNKYFSRRPGTAHYASNNAVLPEGQHEPQL